MSSSDSHFTNDQLSAYLLGADSKRDAEKIAAHVDDCPSCLAALDQLAQKTDPFLDKLRKISDSMDPAKNPHATTPAANPAVPGYEVLGVIGRGGMGVVYRARQVGLNRLVALKMISAGAHASPEQQVRFRKEANAVAQLQHPGIVQIFDVGSVDGLPFFAMELVEGQNLKDVIDGVPQNPRNSARLVISLAHAVQAAHDKGIVHRDLKPANVLMRDEGQEARGESERPVPVLEALIPKITDFGLARTLNEDGSLTRTGTLAGTPGFMAPEQLTAAATVDVRADVYALGATLYNLITGRPPFHADTPIETLKQVQTQEPISPRSLNPSVERDLETICLKCLEKDPARRYQTARELAEDLERFDKGEPIRARKTGPIGRVWRWAKRNGRLATVSAVLLLLLLSAAIAGPIVAFSFNELALAEQKSAQDARTALQKAEEAETQAVAAAKKADDLKRQAETEAATSKEVSKFLLGLFDDADPIAWSGRAFGVMNKANPTAEEIVARGARQLAANEELKSKPLVRAALLDRIGAIYVGLGDTEKGRPLLNEALALRRQHLPTPHRDLADSLESHSNLHFAAGDFARAEKDIREALAMRIALFGPDSTAVADLKTQFGMVLTVQRKNREAETVLIEALRVYRASRNQPLAKEARTRESPWVFVAIGALIHVYLSHDEVAGYLKAAPLVTEVREIAQNLPDQPLGRIIIHFIEAENQRMTGVMLKNVSADAANASFKAAETEFVQAFGLAKKLGKEDHYLIVALQREYAGFLMEFQRFEEAEPLYQQIVAVFRKQFGDRTPEALSHALYNLARCVARGRAKSAPTPEERLKAQLEAEAYSRESVALGRRGPFVNATTHASGHATHLLFHGVLLRSNPMSDIRESEECLREAMKLRRKEHPAGSALNMHPFRALLQILVNQRRYKDAEALLRDEWSQSSKRDWPKDFAPILYQLASKCAFEKADDLAVMLLDAAVEAGFRDASAIQSNPSFAIISKRDDFVQILKKLPPSR